MMLMRLSRWEVEVWRCHSENWEYKRRTGESLPKEMELEPVLPAAEFPENQRFTKLVWQALPQVMFPN